MLFPPPIFGRSAVLWRAAACRAAYAILSGFLCVPSPGAVLLTLQQSYVGTHTTLNIIRQGARSKIFLIIIPTALVKRPPSDFPVGRL